jgi:hypothetical protein
METNTGIGRPSTALMTVLGALAASPTLHAADWQFAPCVEFGALYDDNFTLTENSAGEVKVEGAIVDAMLGIESRTPTTEFVLRPRVEATYYPDEPEHDSTDTFATLNFSRRGLRNAYGVVGSYSHQSVTQSDLPDTEFDPDLGEIDGGESGRFFIQNRRDQLQLRPSASFELTERSALEVEARYWDVSYDRTVPGNQEGYTDTSASVGVAYEMTPLSTITVSGIASQYEPDAVTGRESNSYSAQLRWAKQFSETQSFYLLGGSTRTDFDDPPLGTTNGSVDSEDTVLFGAGAKWAFRVTDVFVDLAHRVSPSSRGAVQVLDELRFRLVRRLSPTVSALASGRYAQTDSDTVTGVSEDRKYAAATIGLEWRFTRQWSFGGTYDHRWRKDEGDVSDAQSNGIFLGMSYEPRRR